jgi:hypothetical protein
MHPHSIANSDRASSPASHNKHIQQSPTKLLFLTMAEIRDELIEEEH